MKKLFISLLVFFSFMGLVYGDSLYCYIGKEESENTVLKMNDEVTVYFKSSFITEVTKAKYQVYFDPYVFDIVMNGEEYIFHEEGLKIINVKKHSSLLEFEISNEDLAVKEFPIVYAKFKVKENAKDGSTTIELIDDNSYIKQIQHVQIDNEDADDPIEGTCRNTKLYYAIDNDSDKIKYDSTLSYIGIDNEIGYISPVFSPDETDYTIYLFKKPEEVYLELICSVDGCVKDDTPRFNVDNNKKISIETKLDDSSTKYNIEFVSYEEEYEYEEPILSSLTIRKYKMAEEFDEYRNTYHVVVPEDEDSLLIDYESDYDVKIDGNSDFKIGENIVVITVTSKSGTFKYYIVVQKQEKEVIEDTYIQEETKEDNKKEDSPNNFVANLTIGIILLITLVVLTIFIFGNKDKKE